MFGKKSKKEKSRRDLQQRNNNGRSAANQSRDPEEAPRTDRSNTTSAARDPDVKKASVIIVGGGPVGLITGLLLKEYGRRSKVEYTIHLYERRIKCNEEGKMVWKNKSDGNNRRGQVTTIQSNVWSLLPPHVKTALFDTNDKDAFIEMWPLGPDSNRLVGFPRNIPIKRTENVLLDLIQKDSGDRETLKIDANGSTVVSETEQPKTKLYAEAFDRNKVDYPFDFIVMADGGASRTEKTYFPDAFGARSNFAGIEPDFKDAVLGIYLDGSDTDGKEAFDVSLSESMALTVSQNRFLLNPLGKKRGFLNMWLTEEEAKEAIGDDGRVCTQRAPCVFAFDEATSQFRCPTHGALFNPAAKGQESALWRRIKDGLKLYGIPESCVKSFTKFQLGPYYRRANFLAPITNNNNLKAFAFVVGDAAMQVNFRAGRGLNTGIKGSVMLTRTLTHLLTSGRRRSQWHASLVDYEGFMSMLQEREVFVRTLLMMKGTGSSPEIDDSATSHRMQLAFETFKNTSPDKRAVLEKEAREMFYSTVSNVAKRSFSASRLPNGIDAPSLERLKKSVDSISGESLYMLASCGAWNTDAAGGKEVGFNDVAEPIWQIPANADQDKAYNTILKRLNDPELKLRMGRMNEVKPEATKQTTMVGTSQQQPKIMAPVEPMKLPFPDRPKISIGDLSNLEHNGFTKGLVSAMVANCESFPVRYFIVDNSGSMNTADGKKLIETMNGDSHRLVQCTRWEQISESINYHANLSGLLSAPTVFRFLNQPGNKAPTEFSIAAKSTDLDKIDEERKEIRSIMKKTSPNGFTPLCDMLKHITSVIEPMSDILIENGQKAAVTIATDGLPTDINGKSTNAIQEEFITLLRKLHELPVWIVITLYTNDSKVISFYDKLDMELELSIDVLEGYFGEAKKVVAINPWINYGYALHQMREIGLDKRIYDMLDERRLTRTEVREYCCCLFGEECADSLPDPNFDWTGFINEIQHLNRIAKRTYDPIKRKSMPWVDVMALERIYGDESVEFRELNPTAISFCGIGLCC